MNDTQSYDKQSYDTSNPDFKICAALTLGDGWLGNMLAFEQHLSPRGDLASDYHDYCHMNALDPHEVNSAVSFLKQIKMEQKLNKIAEDF